MRTWGLQYALFVGLAVPACHEPAAPRVVLAIDGPPAFTAVAISNTYKEFVQPRNIWTRQYELWLAIPPSASANAGVVLTPDAPVFTRSGDTLRAASPRDIVAGDSLLVWHDGRVSYGTVQAPPDAPAYFGTQVVIVHGGG